MPKKKKTQKDDNVVYIGDKPVSVYVLSVMSIFNSGHKEVLIKGRGKNIKKCVDLFEVLKNRYMPELSGQAPDITTNTETLERDGKSIRVSAITILVKK